MLVLLLWWWWPVEESAKAKQDSPARLLLFPMQSTPHSSSPNTTSTKWPQMGDTQDALSAALRACSCPWPFNGCDEVGFGVWSETMSAKQLDGFLRFSRGTYSSRPSSFDKSLMLLLHSSDEPVVISSPSKDTFRGLFCCSKLEHAATRSMCLFRWRLARENLGMVVRFDDTTCLCRSELVVKRDCESGGLLFDSQSIEWADWSAWLTPITLTYECDSEPSLEKWRMFHRILIESGSLPLRSAMHERSVFLLRVSSLRLTGLSLSSVNRRSIFSVNKEVAKSLCIITIGFDTKNTKVQKQH